MADTKREKNGRFPKGSNGGHHGAKGRSGRKPEYFYERARELATDPTAWDVQLAMAKAGNLEPLKFAAAYAYGKPKDSVSIEGEVTVRVVYDGD